MRILIFILTFFMGVFVDSEDQSNNGIPPLTTTFAIIGQWGSAVDSIVWGLQGIFFKKPSLATMLRQTMKNFPSGFIHRLAFFRDYRKKRLRVQHPLRCPNLLTERLCTYKN